MRRAPAEGHAAASRCACLEAVQVTEKVPGTVTAQGARGGVPTGHRAPPCGPPGAQGRGRAPREWGAGSCRRWATGRDESTRRHGEGRPARDAGILRAELCNDSVNVKPLENDQLLSKTTSPPGNTDNRPNARATVTTRSTERGRAIGTAPRRDRHGRSRGRRGRGAVTGWPWPRHFCEGTKAFRRLLGRTRSPPKW